MAGRTRKIEKTSNGKTVLAYRATFNEHGELVRRISEETSEMWIYDKAPKGTRLYEKQAGPVLWKKPPPSLKQMEPNYKKVVRMVAQDDGDSIITIIDHGAEVSCALDSKNTILGIYPN